MEKRKKGGGDVERKGDSWDMEREEWKSEVFLTLFFISPKHF